MWGADENRMKTGWKPDDFGWKQDENRMKTGWNLDEISMKTRRESVEKWVLNWMHLYKKVVQLHIKNEYFKLIKYNEYIIRKLRILSVN